MHHFSAFTYLCSSASVTLTGLLGWTWGFMQCQETADLSIVRGKEPGGRGLLPLAGGVKVMWPSCKELKGHLGYTYLPLDQDLGFLYP